MSNKRTFIVRRQISRPRTVLVRCGVVVFGLLALYGMFESGRRVAGFSLARELRQSSEARQRIDSLQNENRDLHTRMAVLETQSASMTRERETVASQIAELQAQIDQDRQDLAVYRGVVAPEMQGATVQVQQLRAIAGDGPLKYTLRLTLMRTGRTDDLVSGAAQVRVRGEAASGAASVSALGVIVPVASTQPDTHRPAASSAAAPVPAAVVTYGFRYYQTLVYTVELPKDLKPRQVEVELQPAGRPEVPAVTQSFAWKLDPN